MSDQHKKLKIIYKVEPTKTDVHFLLLSLAVEFNWSGIISRKHSFLSRFAFSFINYHLIIPVTNILLLITLYLSELGFWNLHNVGLVNRCHFLSPMLHSKVKCIFCNFCTFILCRDFKTFNNPVYILQDNKTNKCFIK